MNICAASSHGQVDLELLGIKKIPRNKIMEQNLRKEESFTSMVEAIEGKCFAERFVWPCHIYRVFTGKEFEGLADLIEALELGDKCDADKVSDDFDFADLQVVITIQKRYYYFKFIAFCRRRKPRIAAQTRKSRKTTKMHVKQSKKSWVNSVTSLRR